MAIEDKINKVELIIDGKDYSKYLVFPIKWQELLDERLDECCISLLRTSEFIFKPLCDAKITIKNNEEVLKEMDFLVCNDKAEEIPSGSGKYNHEIILIELTKWLEGFMCRSIGFTNSLGRIYADKTWDGQDIS